MFRHCPDYMFYGWLTANTGFGETKTLNIVYTEWFPYTYQQEGKASGFEIDIFKAVMENMQIPVAFRRYPWKRCLDQLKKGNADALISMLYTSNQEAYTYYAEEHISISRTVFATTINNRISFKGSYKDLSEYGQIGYILGFGSGETFDNAKYLKKDSSKDIQGLIKEVLEVQMI